MSVRKRPGIQRNPEAAEVVALIADLYLRGMSLLKICRHLEQAAVSPPAGGRRWHAVTVRGILRNPHHAGLIRHDGKYVKGAHYAQRIYDPEVFHQILAEMGSRRRFGPQTLACTQASLSFVAVCDECGDRLRILQPSDPYRSYRCEGGRRKGLVCNSRPYVRGQYLEKAVVREIERIAADPAVLELAECEATRMISAGASDHVTEIDSINARIAEVERKWLQLANDRASGIVSDAMLSTCDREFSQESRILEERMTQLQRIQDTRVDREAEVTRVKQALRDFPSLWGAMEPEEKRTVFTLLVESLRVGRGDGCISVKLKIRFMDEVVLELPIHSIWSDARKQVKKPVISQRQLAYLVLAADGYSDRQIATRWRVKITNVKHMRARAISKLGASSLDAAIELVRRRIDEWREFLPLDWRHGAPGIGVLSLTDPERQALRGIAAGKTDPEMARECAVPTTTISGRRNSLRQKLGVESKEALVAKACALGLLGPSDPSPGMLLRAYRILTLSHNQDRLRHLRITSPTSRQMECLEMLVEGLTAEEASQRMRVGVAAVTCLRIRLWRLVHANSLKMALERIKELGILSWPEQEVATE